MCGHSPAAALADACDCATCKGMRLSFRQSCDTPVHNIDQWHFYQIRSRDGKAIREHRANMRDMGFTVGPIEIAEPWSAHAGKFVFSARIPKAVLSESDMDKLVKWDQEQGE